MQLIVDFDPNGHHPHYIEILLKCGFSGVLLTSSALWNEVSVLVKKSTTADIVVPCENLPSPKKQFEIIDKLLIDNKNITECLHLHFDSLTIQGWWYYLKYALQVNPRISFGGIWFGCNFFYIRVYSPIDWVKYAAGVCYIYFLLYSVPNIKIYFLNNDIVKHFKKYSYIKEKIHWCPDPYKYDKRRLNIIVPQNNRENDTLLILGFHFPHKGTSWALRALLTWRKPLRIIVGGVIDKDPDIKEICKQFKPPVTVELHDRRLSDDDISELYSRSTVLALPYRNFGGSSGIFVNALYRGLPVVATDWGILGKKTKELKAGSVFTPNNEKSFLSSLESVLSNSKNLHDNQNVQKFLINNSPGAFFMALTGREAD